MQLVREPHGENAEMEFGAPGEGGHFDPTDLGDAEAEGGGLGVGLAGINHHQTLVLSECQVPSCGDMADAKWLAPAKVAPTPAEEGEGKMVRDQPRSSHGDHGLSSNFLKPQPLSRMPQIFCKSFLESPILKAAKEPKHSGTLIISSQAFTASSCLPRCL